MGAVRAPLSLGLVGLDWSMGSSPRLPGPHGKEEDDDECFELDTHLAAVSALLDDADTPNGESTLRVDAPEFVPMHTNAFAAPLLHAPRTQPPPPLAMAEPQPAVRVPPPMPTPAVGGADGPALRSYWAQSGSFRIEWKVPCSKLMSKDKIVVSPPFNDLGQARTFKLLLQPRSKPGPGDELGCPAFGSTRFGSLQLKCVEDRDTVETVCFRLFIGEEPSCILRHNFKSCAVVKHEHLWDLRAEVDGRSRTLVVGVEFIDG